MEVVNTIIAFIISLLDKMLPAIGIPEEFISATDTAISWLITLIQSGGYFIPLDIFVMCMTAMLIADNWTLLFRIGQWILKLIRG